MDIYKDKTQSISERIEDLMFCMTLDEKLAQLCSDLPNEMMMGCDIPAI